MSTTFDIIPTETDEITFGQVLQTSESKIAAFLNSVGIQDSIRLKIILCANKENHGREILQSDKFEWADNECIWFTVEGISGGTDAYCSVISDTKLYPEDPWWLLDGLEANNKAIKDIQLKLEKSKAFNKVWTFSRSAGQSGIIALSYGLISASVAELTKGIVWSDDSAWDYERFPAESHDFFDWYFRPEKALNPRYAEWASTCINGLREELKAAK